MGPPTLYLERPIEASLHIARCVVAPRASLRGRNAHGSEGEKDRGREGRAENRHEEVAHVSRVASALLPLRSSRTAGSLFSQPVRSYEAAKAKNETQHDDADGTDTNRRALPDCDRDERSDKRQ